MTTVARNLIDALAGDLESNAGLREHRTVKYRRPRIILPEECPLLVVWLEAKVPTPKTTVWFDSAITIGVSWHEETVDEVTTLIDNEDISISLMESLERIEERVRVLARDGMSDSWQVLPGESRYLSPELQQGLTEGYALAVEARVTED